MSHWVFRSLSQILDMSDNLSIVGVKTCATKNVQKFLVKDTSSRKACMIGLCLPLNPNSVRSVKSSHFGGWAVIQLSVFSIVVPGDPWNLTTSKDASPMYLTAR